MKYLLVFKHFRHLQRARTDLLFVVEN